MWNLCTVLLRMRPCENHAIMRNVDTRPNSEFVDILHMYAP